MTIYPIETGNFKLDGGGMFGVVPKTLWSRTNPADENNMCTWSLRCMLIEDGDRLTLIDTGIGDKQSEKFFSHFYLHGDDSLDGSLKELGFSRDDITDIFLTHLHFDHCGGAVEWNEKKDALRPVSKNATFWSNARHWSKGRLLADYLEAQVRGSISMAYSIAYFFHSFFILCPSLASGPSLLSSPCSPSPRA